MATGTGSPAANRRREEGEEGYLQECAEDQPPSNTTQTYCSGYDCEFVKPPPIEFPQTDCPVCLLVLREPCQVGCCGYSYCEDCIKRVQSDKKPCPSCHKANFVVFPDKRLKRSLYALNVYCCRRGAGCQWAGELGELDRHLNPQPSPEALLVGCQFSVVDCTYCAQSFERRYVQAHQLNHCAKRPYTCQYCGQHASLFEDVTQNHWPVCPSFPLSCPNNCELVLQHQELEHHISQDCPFTLLLCDFHMVGCSVQLARRDLLSHINENLTGHMSLLSVYMMAHPNENIATCMGLMVGTIQSIVIGNVTLRSKLYKAKQTLRQTCYELQETLDLLEQSRKKTAQLLVTVTSQNEIPPTQAKEIEVHSNQQDQFHKNSTLSHKNKRVRKPSVQQNATHPTHRESTTFELTFDQHKREIQERLRTVKDEMSKTMAASEHRIQNELNKQQASITQQKHELIEKLSVSEKKLQARLAEQKALFTKFKVEKGERMRLFRTLVRKQLSWEAELMTVTTNLNSVISASEKEIQTQKDNHQKYLDKVTCTGLLPFEFTMTKFEQHKKASDMWYSPAFYTHTHGYKMCIRVYANGNISGKGTHISVYGCLMRGDFDEGLQWPYQGKITIELLNQLEDSKHHTHTINFTVTANPSMIGRVTSGVVAGAALGKEAFIAHTQLDLNTKSNCHYAKENQLKFRVSQAVSFDLSDRICRRCFILESFAETVEVQVCVAPINFILSDFVWQKRENNVWCSPAFYTHPRGYRICLEVYPNGVVDGHGMYVSLFACILRGPFDSQLKWPLRGRVKVQIENQVEDKNHHKGIIEYTDQTPHSKACRVTERDRSASWGTQMFISHYLLGYNAASRTQYLQGDSLHIKISKVTVKK